MTFKVLSKRKAHNISNGIFLVSIGILVITGAWWPGIILAIWATVASRQYLTGRLYNALVTTIVLLGLFILSFLKFNFAVLAPILLIVGGLFIIVKEYFFAEATNGEEKSEEILEDADIDEPEKK